MPGTPIGTNSDDTNHVHNSITTSSSYVNDAEGLTFPEVCERVYGKVEAFLNKEAKSERVKAVQEQTRTSLNVIEEALRKYRYVDADLWNGEDLLHKEI